MSCWPLVVWASAVSYVIGYAFGHAGGRHWRD